MKQQILVVHGGDSFDSYKEYLDNLEAITIDLDRFRHRNAWKSALQEDLGEKFDVLTPNMPNSNNAQYEEWKIWFEKIMLALENEIVLIGHSLGGVFIAKYLAENDLDKKLKAVVLVAAPYQAPEGLGQFKLKTNLNNFEKQVRKILLIQSEDDLIVPRREVDMYKKELPKAKTMIFKDRGHFQVEHLPELVSWLKKL